MGWLGPKAVRAGQCDYSQVEYLNTSEDDSK